MIAGLLRSWGALFRTELAIMMQYRAEIVLWSVWTVVYPAIGIAMWTAAVAGSEGGEAIAGYGRRDFAAYFLMTMIVGHFCQAWDIFETGPMIQSGAMSDRLLRPILPIWENASANVSYKLLTTIVLIPAWIVTAWLTEPAFSSTGVHLVLGTVAVMLAATLNFLWGYTLSLSGFWLTRTQVLGEIWFGTSLFLGGRLAPLDLLPGPLRVLADALPFKWITWFPSELLSGQLGLETAIWGLVAQWGWVVVAVIAFRIVWPIALRRHAAVGG